MVPVTMVATTLPSSGSGASRFPSVHLLMRPIAALPSPVHSALGGPWQPDGSQPTEWPDRAPRGPTGPLPGGLRAEMAITPFVCSY
ncbi:hypothetical protein SCA03_21460 [Streptomyces cacaoi]|uniref:Uncharacterized protein n=1 Tax=Streptomyces cacaoi TaxID=1898 RepID=A0A4Y3QW56_STRCI|nr:hypothetical protein SCA03_21460 [Streptomyces cacaoi]